MLYRFRTYEKHLTSADHQFIQIFGIQHQHFLTRTYLSIIMLRAAVQRAFKESATPIHEPTSYFADHYPDNSLNPMDGDATTSPAPSGARSKQSYSSSRNSRRHRAGTQGSVDSSTIVSDRNPSNSDWNSRRRSDFSGITSYAVSWQRHASDPPRPAKDGMEWVWFPAGYWAERERVEIGPRKEDSPRKWFNRSSSSPSRRTSNPQKPPDILTSFSQSLEVPMPRKGSGFSGISNAESRLEKLRLGFSYMSPTYPHFVSPSGEREGLYCKTKRNVEGKLVPKRKLVGPMLSFWCFKLIIVVIGRR